MYISKDDLILEENGVRNNADFKYLYATWESYVFLHLPSGKKISFRRYDYESN